MNIFKFEFKRLIKSAIMWSIICSGLIIMFMSLFPSMESSGIQDLVGSKLEAMPSALLEAFNISGAMDFTNINDYMGYALQYIGIATGIFGAILGVSALSTEESSGTIEFLYSKPISRISLVTNKILSALAILYLFIIIIGAVTIGICAVVKPDNVEWMTLLMDIKSLYIGMFLSASSYMAVGFLTSVLIKAKKNPVPVALALFFTTYVVGIFSKLKESVDWLLYVSPFDYFLPSKILSEGFEGKYIIIALGIIVVALSSTYVIYDRKDLES